jgi:hypothetical protein
MFFRRTSDIGELARVEQLATWFRSFMPSSHWDSDCFLVSVSVLLAYRFYFVKNEKIHVLRPFSRFIRRTHIFKTMTDDETRVFHYDTTKRQIFQSRSSKSQRLKTTLMWKWTIRAMLICFFDTNGIPHYKYTPQGQTTKHSYFGTL